MFDITIDGNTLYHPNSVDYNIISGVIHEKLNDSGYMELTIPYSNPAYESIVERKSKIIVFKDNVELWYGEVRDVSKDFSKNKSLYIVGEASFLNDTVQPQRKLTGTKFQVLEEMLNYHNSMIEAEKHFQIGAIGKGATDHIEVVTDWEHTLDAIRKHLCGVEEYFRIRHVNGVRYLDIMPLETYGKYSEQEIRFGENLLDYAEESTGADIATTCIPLGAKLEEEGIEGYQNYLTCESVNNGKNYVELPSAISRLGHITKVVKFEDVTDPNVLLTKAVNYLKTAQYATLTLNLTAIDLSILRSDIDNYAVGDYVPAICEPLGMNALFPVRERQTDIVNIENNTIKIGASGTKTVTQQSAESIKELEHKMPNKDDILTAALKNASAMINANGDNGNGSIRLNSDGKPYEIVIMDADTIENSTRAWRWNLNGFGHGTKKAGDPEFTWEANVAITMDGGIVADSITSGTLRGREINNGNGTFQVTSSGELTASKGKIAGFTISSSNLVNGDSIFDRDRIGCGSAGNGIVNILGSSVGDSRPYGCIQLSNSGNWQNPLDGIRIFGDGRIVKYDGRGNVQWTRYLSNILDKGLDEYFCGSGGKNFNDMSSGDLVLKK